MYQHQVIGLHKGDTVESINFFLEKENQFHVTLHILNLKFASSSLQMECWRTKTRPESKELKTKM